MKRIEELIKYIYPSSVIADIGCDHGYLIKLAYNQGLIKKAYAIDNKIGPLNNAKRNLVDCDNVTYLLSNGISEIGDDTNIVILAGMGGNLIVKILEKDFDKLEHVDRVIVEANRNSELVRIFAINHHLKIVSEAIIEEDSIFYEIIVLEKGNMALTDDEIKFGPILLKNKDEMFIKKWSKQLAIYQEKNTIKLEKEINKIKEILNYEN